MTSSSNMATTDPALSVLDRALQGDAGALSFLDRTLSIYVLDATDPSKPKTYGSWNFIHEVMNEVERYESSLSTEINLERHVQLLANIAKRVARKPPLVDQQLVETCISNAPNSFSSQQLQELVKINHEMREIVMGRIAAICLDAAFYAPTSRSAFSGSSMEALCAVLAANAVATGPKAIEHFFMEWIIPSRETMPALAVTLLVLHVAMEAIRKEAPVGTRDMLQQLSQATMGLIVVPALAQTVDTNNNNASDYTNLMATCVRAMERWFVATDLSLPQMKHLCHKVSMDVIQIMSDVMYSDSDVVIDGMAEWMEVALVSGSKMSPSRMAQARHLIHVDEQAFSQSISPQELARIEQKEMLVILQELMSAISLQRFRFVERTARAHHGICRNLTRISVATCRALSSSSSSSPPPRLEEGMVDLLLKAASHPMVYVCSMALEELSKLVLQDVTFCFRLLPVLQHRAIVPHLGGANNNNNTAVPSIANMVDACGVDLDEFESFRQHVLGDALLTCFRENPNYYMDSCTSAIEEFCNSAASSIEVGFQLEAALFCLVAVASEALQQQDNSQDPNRSTSEKNHDAQLERCMVSLTSQPLVVASSNNPLLLAQVCRFFQEYAGWLAARDGGGIDAAANAALTTFNMASTAIPAEAQTLLEEMSVSPFSRAAKALESILTLAPKRFATIPAITTLGGAWEASYVASNQGKVVTVEDRKVLCRGICCVLASLPHDQRSKSFLALTMPTVDCLEKMTKFADDTRADAPQPHNTATSPHEHLDSVLVRIAHEIQVLSTMTHAFNDFVSNSTMPMESGCLTSGPAADGQATVKNPSLGVLKRTWPCIVRMASTYYSHDQVTNALGELLADSVPRDIHDDESFSLLKDLYEVACVVLQSVVADNVSPKPVFVFVEEVVRVHGNGVERSASASSTEDTSSQGRSEEISRLVESLLLTSVDAARATLWTTQTTLGKEQGQGQQPFECKTEPRPVTQEREKSTEALSGLFSILTLCTQKCPVFLVHLPITADAADRDDDSLLVRTVEAAVAALVETQDEVSRSAMMFLKAAVELHDSSTLDGGQNGIQTVRQVLEGVLTRTRRSIIMMLVSSACGTCAHISLEPAALLFTAIVKTFSQQQQEANSILVAALQQQHFILGDEARLTTLRVLEKCVLGSIPQSLVSQIFADLWMLHQTSQEGSVAGGDAVYRFVETYSDNGERT